MVLGLLWSNIALADFYDLKIDLNKYISSNSSIENKSDVVDNLKKLNDLYKSGVLTKEEFEKAKA